MSSSQVGVWGRGRATGRRCWQGVLPKFDCAGEGLTIGATAIEEGKRELSEGVGVLQVREEQ